MRQSVMSAINSQILKKQEDKVKRGQQVIIV
jgi:hypothetical protein